MRDLDTVFDALARSAFRRRFALGVREGKYLREKGIDTVIAQAHELIGKRLAPQSPLNDGKQTPFRGHPVFIAQHATATCCRSCLAKWHGIAAGKALDEAERQHVVDAIGRWLRAQPLPTANAAAPDNPQRELPF
ncbi:DUF4186 domain-containing protein [Caballeronia sp. INDeC2]|uniref:DUF4186 domain-containing protein n=1 Tax=Caballeronia sp. INDeC2 TaxID=2921747 RepID=UPI002027D19F|nr:DUF4186 domain-containing protein [Caballeronia sp. INDeC2]